MPFQVDFARVERDDAIEPGHGKFFDVGWVALEQAQAAGELPADEDCGNLATFISDAWQGVLARLKVGRTLQPLDAFVTRLERLLQA